MNPTRIDFIVWALISVAQAILALVLVKRGAVKRWPFLFAVCLFDLVHSYLCFTHLGYANYRQFFNIYWFGHVIRSILMLGVLWDVARRFPLLWFVPRHIGLAIASFAATVTMGAVLITAGHHSHSLYPYVGRLLMIRESVGVAWMCFAIGLIASISFLGMGWGNEELDITSGMVVSGVASMIIANLTSSSPKHGPLLNNIETCIQAAVLIFWSIKVGCATPEPPSETVREILNELLEEPPLV